MKSIPANNLQKEYSLLSPLFEWLQTIKRHWGRLEPPSNTVMLQYHRIYVLPTKSGLRFAAIVLLLFLGSINYESNLGLLFCFLLIWMALISILHTYRNLAGLVLEAGVSEPAFAGQDLYFKMELKNPDNWTRETIRVRFRDGSRVSISLGPYQSQAIEVPIPAPHRGLFRPEKFRVYTQFPLGLFSAWSMVEFAAKCVVYPKPAEKTESFFSFFSKFFREGKITQEGKEDFGGFRKYQPGDSLKHIAWKALARGDEVLTKEFIHPESETLWLNWQTLPTGEDEDKLSFLCRCVLEAERMGHHYGLLIPSSRIEPNVGEPHKHHCLRSLAVFDEKKIL